MITRYEKKEISQIWSEQARAEYYLKVELSLLEALEEKEMIPKGTSLSFENVKIDTKRINEIEKEVKHDIIAFSSSVTEQVDKKHSKYFHFGVTSSDIIDTAQNLQIKDSLKIILKSFKNLNQEMINLVDSTIDTIGVGRSHGMFAEAMSYGQKFMGHYAEFARVYKQLKVFFENEITGQLSGAVGNYTILNPQIEKSALKKLGLSPEPVSTQIIPRDRLSTLTCILAGLAGAIERLSVEFRHLHRSEVGELFEGFSKGQKGSSTMPHKKNPISSENLTGIARMIRSYVSIAFENNILWHERDISHSSAERIYLPDCLGLSLYAIERMTSTIKCLVVKKEVIENRSNGSDSLLSSYYLHQLILHAPLSREEIYEIIQSASFEYKESGTDLDIIINRILKDKGLKVSLTKSDITQLKNKYRKTATEIKARVLQSYPLDY